MAAQVKIASFDIGAGGTTSIDFTSIPQNYTDLLLVLSCRSSNASTYVQTYLTANGTNLSEVNFYNDNGTVGSSSGSTNRLDTPGSTNTTSAFSNQSIYIYNYASSSTYKSFTGSAINMPSNGSYYQMGIWTIQYGSNSPITSLSYAPVSGSFVQYSSGTLYGISRI